MNESVATITELQEAGVLLRQVGKKMVALFQVGEEIFAVEDLCPHRAGPLSEGKRDGTVVTCPWHNAKFDLRTGKVLCGPATRPLKRFNVVIEDGKIGVELKEKEQAARVANQPGVS